MSGYDEFSSASDIRAYIDEQWPKIDSLGPKLGFSPDISRVALEHQNEYRFEVLRAALGAALERIEELEGKLAN